MMAKGLFLCKCARSDIQTKIVFLDNRFKETDKYDWKKVFIVMMYFNGTKELFLTLSADGMNILKCFVETSYATHAAMKIHTGSVTATCEGRIITKPKKKLNTKSSIEEELVGNDDIIPNMLWTNCFKITSLQVFQNFDGSKQQEWNFIGIK